MARRLTPRAIAKIFQSLEETLTTRIASTNDDTGERRLEVKVLHAFAVNTFIWAMRYVFPTYDDVDDAILDGEDGVFTEFVDQVVGYATALSVRYGHIIHPENNEGGVKTELEYFSELIESQVTAVLTAQRWPDAFIKPDSTAAQIRAARESVVVALMREAARINLMDHEDAEDDEEDEGE